MEEHIVGHILQISSSGSHGVARGLWNRRAHDVATPAAWYDEGWIRRSLVMESTSASRDTWERSSEWFGARDERCFDIFAFSLSAKGCSLPAVTATKHLTSCVGVTGFACPARPRHFSTDYFFTISRIQCATSVHPNSLLDVCKFGCTLCVCEFFWIWIWICRVPTSKRLDYCVFLYKINNDSLWF